MSGLKVLLVDDESNIRELIRVYMAGGEYETDEASNGPTALELVSRNQYDVVILDLMMPGMDGWTVLSSIRRISDVPVIILSGRGEEYEKLLGFQLGVDDYMVKPFSPRELLARIHAIAARRRPLQEPVDTTIIFGTLRIDPNSRRVHLNREVLPLTPREFDLLYFLASHPGKAFSREVILSAVWGQDYQGDGRTVDTHIKQLRERLGKERGLIATVWGVGYRLDPDALS